MYCISTARFRKKCSTVLYAIFLSAFVLFMSYILDVFGL